jgi:hypothetical protein
VIGGLPKLRLRFSGGLGGRGWSGLGAHFKCEEIEITLRERRGWNRRDVLCVKVAVVMHWTGR